VGVLNPGTPYATIEPIVIGLFSGVDTYSKDETSLILLSGDSSHDDGYTPSQIIPYNALAPVWTNQADPHFEARGCAFIKSSSLSGGSLPPVAIVGVTARLNTSGAYVYTADVMVFDQTDEPSSLYSQTPSFSYSTGPQSSQVYAVGVGGQDSLMAVGTRIDWSDVQTPMEPNSNGAVVPVKGKSFLPNWIVNLKSHKMQFIQGPDQGGQTVDVVVANILGGPDPDILFIQGGEAGSKGQSYIVPSTEIFNPSDPDPSKFILLGGILDGRSARVANLMKRPGTSPLLDIVLVCVTDQARWFEQTSKGVFKEHLLTPDTKLTNCAGRGLAISPDLTVTISYMAESGQAVCGLVSYEF